MNNTRIAFREANGAWELSNGGVIRWSPSRGRHVYTVDHVANVYHDAETLHEIAVLIESLDASRHEDREIAAYRGRAALGAYRGDA